MPSQMIFSHQIFFVFSILSGYKFQGYNKVFVAYLEEIEPLTLKFPMVLLGPFGAL